MIHRIPIVALGVMIGSACGPTVEPPDQTGSGSSSDSPPMEATTATTSAANTTTVDPSTTGVSGSTSLDTSLDSSSSNGFINEPDAGDCLVVGPEEWHSCIECDLFAQDCQRGDKCMPWASDGSDRWNAKRCSPVADDPDALGEPCTVEGSPTSGVDSCEYGAMCWDVDERTLEGTCVSICAGDGGNPICPASTGCMLAYDGALAVCLPHCNPLAPDCAPGDLCVANDDFFFCVPAREEAMAGEACDYFDDCAPGLVCLDSETVGPSCDQGRPGCCTSWCDVSEPDPSAVCADPGQECVFWWEGFPPPPLEDLGACMTPPA